MLREQNNIYISIFVLEIMNLNLEIIFFLSLVKTINVFIEYKCNFSAIELISNANNFRDCY